MKRMKNVKYFLCLNASSDENEDLQMTSRVILRLTVGGTPFWRKLKETKTQTVKPSVGTNLCQAALMKYLKYCFFSIYSYLFDEAFTISPLFSENDINKYENVATFLICKSETVEYVNFWSNAVL